jgi:3-deoxy-7-phosphoheptulonate synthase
MTRNTLDVSAVPLVHKLSHLPIIIDPSHSSGRHELVAPLALAAAAVGADGVMIDIHPKPEAALCDGPQALKPEELKPLVREIAAVAQAVGKPMARAKRALSAVGS